MMRETLFVALGIVVLSACGGSSGTTADAGAGGSVVGTWRRDSNYGASSRSLTITFDADGSMTADETFTVVASSAAANGGCSSAIGWDGTWMTSGTTLTVTAASGERTTTGCNDASMNASMRAATADELGRFSSVSTFTLTGNMLAFTSYMDPAAFTRQ